MARAMARTAVMAACDVSGKVLRLLIRGLCRSEVQVIRNQKLAGSDGTRACRGVQMRATDVWSPHRFFRREVTQTFELPSTHIFKIDTVWSGGCSLVEIHRNLRTAPDLQSCLRASIAHSAREIPLTGTNGTTSAAPIRGCTPLCRVRSISRAAWMTPRTAASTTAAGGPAKVTTERLCAASRDQSSRRTPPPHGRNDLCNLGDVRALGEVGHAFDEASDSEPRRPSDFTSTICSHRELHAGVDAGILVAQRGARDMDRIRAEVERTVRAEKVVHADAELRGEVPDAGVGCSAVVPGVPDVMHRMKGRPAERWIFVVRPDQAAATLNPRRTAVSEPAKFQRRRMGVIQTPVKVPPTV